MTGRLAGKTILLANLPAETIAALVERLSGEILRPHFSQLRPRSLRWQTRAAVS